MLLPLLFSAALAQTPPPPGNNPDTWLSRLLTHATAWERFRHQGQEGWRWESLTEKLARDGRVEEVETESYETIRLEGRAFSRLVKHNGAAPTPGELRKQAQEEEELLRKTREARARGLDLPEDDDHIRFDAAFLKRFAFTWAGHETRQGQDCVVLTFQGKQEGGLTLRPQEIILRRLHGRLWLSSEDGALVHLEASLPQPVTVGFIATRVEQLTLGFDQQRGPHGLWVPARYEMTLHGRALIRRLDSHTVAQWIFPEEGLAAVSEP